MISVIQIAKRWIQLGWDGQMRRHGLSCFHQNSHTRVAGFLSEGWEKAEVIKAVAGNNRKQKGRKRGSTSPGFERKRNSPGELGDVGPHIFVVSFVHPKA